MAVSVRMDRLLELEIEQAARQRGITKSQFIIESVERALGRKDPYKLLLQVQEEMAPYRAQWPDGPKPAAARKAATGSALSHSDRLRAILQAKHQAALKDWAAYHGKTAEPPSTAASAKTQAASARKTSSSPRVKRTP